MKRVWWNCCLEKQDGRPVKKGHEYRKQNKTKALSFRSLSRRRERAGVRESKWRDGVRSGVPLTFVQSHNVQNRLAGRTHHALRRIGKNQITNLGIQPAGGRNLASLLQSADHLRFSVQFLPGGFIIREQQNPAKGFPSMKTADSKSGNVLHGPTFSGPLQLIVATPITEEVKIVGRSLQSGKGVNLNK